MQATLRKNPEILEIENKNRQFDPQDWWIYKTSGSGINVGEEYLNHPVCEFTEVYYLLFILIMQKAYSSHKQLIENHLITVSVYSYDEKLNTTAYAIKKNAGLPSKISQKYRYDLGNRTFLLLTSPLAGSVCSGASFILNNSGLMVVQAVRPLLYNQPWVPQLLEKEIKTFVAPPTPHDINLLKLGLKMIQQHGYIESILAIIRQLQLPIEEETFLFYSKLPKVDYTKKVKKCCH